MKKVVPFDLEKAKAGAKVVTRAGNPIRIKHFNGKIKPYTVVASIKEYGEERTLTFTELGQYDKCRKSRYDLFIEEEKEEPTTKIEPKFKVGDWIVQDNAGIYKVTEICKSWYEVIDSKGWHYSIDFDQESMCHLWAIQEARPGDVLVCIGGKYGQEIGIVKKYVGKYGGCDKCFETYCFVDWEGRFRLGEYMGSKEIYPATKEQYDLLFLKMKEAGYEWNSDKKELHKIEKVKTRRMTIKELAWWLRDHPEEHREFKYKDTQKVDSHGSYNECDQNEECNQNIVVRRNGGEWQEPLVGI